MTITKKNSRYAGIFIDDKKVRKELIAYLVAIDELSLIHENITSSMVIHRLNKGSGSLETLTRLQDLGYISSDTEKRYRKKWKLTEIGKRIVELANEG